MEGFVKTIFKILLGTATTIVVSCMLIEYLNVTIVSYEILTMSRIAAYQSCAMFAQETYKDATNGHFTMKVDDMLNDSGGVYASGTFYPYNAGNPVEMARNNYMAMYKNNAYFDAFYNQISSQGKWFGLDRIKHGLAGDDESGYYKNVGKQLVAQQVTPINIGVPYIDPEIGTKIFRWELAKMFSNCDPTLIVQDDNGTYGVKYKGFMIYAQDSYLADYNTNKGLGGTNGFDYKVMDKGSADFENATHIETAANIGYGSHSSMVTSEEYATERERICVLGINYKLKVSYIGVTPMRRVFAFVTRRVAGWGGTPRDMGGAPAMTYSEFTGGGLTGLASKVGYDGLPITGKCNYYIVR